MKRFYLILLCSLLLSFTVKGESSKDILKGNKEIVWLGLDFTHAKFIGFIDYEQGIKVPKLLVEKWIPSWNHLMLKEAKKYNVGRLFRKRIEVINDFSLVKELNRKIDVKDIFAKKTNPFTEEEILSFVKNYNLKGEKIAISFIVEAFDKNKNKATINIVVFEPKSLHILTNKRVEANAGGFGFRNFWAGAIYRIIKETKL